MNEDVLGIVWMLIASTSLLFVTNVVLFRAWQRERQLRESRIEKTLDVLGVRLEALTESVDTVQLEVERIGELERFATKLLVANGQRDGRVITPH
jgi:hypothetical protein